jgi:hypothetical protein
MLRLAVALLAASLAVAQAPKKDLPKAPAKPAAEPAKPVVDQAKPKAGAFVGNSESKVFHKPECPAAKKMKADKQVALASREEAEKKGFKACKLCLK